MPKWKILHLFLSFSYDFPLAKPSHLKPANPLAWLFWDVEGDKDYYEGSISIIRENTTENNNILTHDVFHLLKWQRPKGLHCVDKCKG